MLRLVQKGDTAMPGDDPHDLPSLAEMLRAGILAASRITAITSHSTLDMVRADLDHLDEWIDLAREVLEEQEP